MHLLTDHVFAESITLSGADYACTAGSPLDCRITCNTEQGGNNITIDCGNAKDCYFYCKRKDCFSQNSILDARDSQNLYVITGPNGQNCMTDSQIYTPGNGNAYFDSTQNSRGLRRTSIYSGSNTQNITIMIDNDAYSNDAAGLSIYASTANFVQIILGNGIEWHDNNAFLECPIASTYTGPEIAPCIIDGTTGAQIGDLTIAAPDGIPKGVWIKGNPVYTGPVTIICDNGISNAPFTASSTCWATRDPTIDPTANPTRIPTEVPSVNPTESPSPIPTIAPTQIPSDKPTKSPSIIPTISPSLSPSSPTQIPSSHPSINPSVLPTTAPTSNPSSSPLVAGETINPSISPLISTILPTSAPNATIHGTLDNNDIAVEEPSTSMEYENTLDPFDGNSIDESTINPFSSLHTIIVAMSVGLCMCCCIGFMFYRNYMNQKKKMKESVSNLQTEIAVTNVVIKADIDSPVPADIGSPISLSSATTDIDGDIIGLIDLKRDQKSLNEMMINKQPTPIGDHDIVVITPNGIETPNNYLQESDSDGSEDLHPKNCEDLLSVTSKGETISDGVESDDSSKRKFSLFGMIIKHS